jgi:hypothetical protein
LLGRAGGVARLAKLVVFVGRDKTVDDGHGPNRRKARAVARCPIAHAPRPALALANISTRDIDHHPAENPSETERNRRSTLGEKAIALRSGGQARPGEGERTGRWTSISVTYAGAI